MISWVLQWGGADGTGVVYMVYVCHLHPCCAFAVTATCTPSCRQRAGARVGSASSARPLPAVGGAGCVLRSRVWRYPIICSALVVVLRYYPPLLPLGVCRSLVSCLRRGCARARALGHVEGIYGPPAAWDTMDDDCLPPTLCASCDSVSALLHGPPNWDAHVTHQCECD